MGLRTSAEGHVFSQAVKHWQTFETMKEWVKGIVLPDYYK